MAGAIKNIHFITIYNNYENEISLQKNRNLWKEYNEKFRYNSIVKEIKAGKINTEKLSHHNRKILIQAMASFHNLSLKEMEKKHSGKKLDFLKKDSNLMEVKDGPKSESEPDTNKSSRSSKGKRKKVNQSVVGTPSSAKTDDSLKKAPKKTPKKKKQISKSKQSRSVSSKNKAAKEESKIKKLTKSLTAQEISNKEMGNLFQMYEDSFGNLVCFLETFNRVHPNFDLLVNKRPIHHQSIYKETRKKMAGRTPRTGNSTFRAEEKRKEPCPKVDSIHAGIPHWIINSSKILLDIDYLPQIFALKNLLPLKTPASDGIKWFNNPVPEPEVWYWLDKKTLPEKESIDKAFKIKNAQIGSEPSNYALPFKEDSLMAMPKVGKEYSLGSEKNYVNVKKRTHLRSFRRSTFLSEYQSDLHAELKNLFTEDSYTSLLTSYEDFEFNSRTVIDPGQEIGWVVQFEPNEVREYYQNVTLSVTGWPKCQMIVEFTGRTEFPAVDTRPEHIFQHVVNVEQRNIRNPCYILPSQLFNFGQIFINNKPSNRVFEKVTEFKFTSITTVPVEMSFTFLDNSSENAGNFGFQPNTLLLEAGETQMLTVWASPQRAGICSQDLIYSILDNPQSMIIRLQCTGVKPELCVIPESLSFSKVLVYQQTAKILSLQNNCALPIKWAFKNTQSLQPMITFSIYSGSLAPKKNEIVNVQYHASKVEVLETSFSVEVFAENSNGQPAQTVVIPVFIESYDVIVNICYVNSDYACLNFGAIKVGVEQHQDFGLKNLGPYDVEFKLEFEDPLPGLNIRPSDFLKLDPMEGVLEKSAPKLTPVTASVICYTEMSFVEAPLINVLLFCRNSPKDAVHIATLSIPVTLSSYFSRFKITPQNELCFETVRLDEVSEKAVVLENIGLFDFNYKIISQGDLETFLEQDELNASLSMDDRGTLHSPRKKISSKEDNYHPSRPEKSEGRKKHPKQLGVFTIQNTKGTIHPKKFVSIKISCHPTVEGNFKEVMLVQISESPEAIKYGIPISLLATGSLPKIDFTNIDFMYKEVIIVEDETADTCLKDGLPYTVYIKKHEVLKFHNVTVGNSQDIKIHLQNVGMLAGKINLRKECPNELSNNVFTASPDTLYIPPFSSSSLVVTFAPTTIEDYECLFFIEVESQMDESYSITLKGKGVIPLVELIQPIYLTTKTQTATVEFPVTMLGLSTSHKFVLKNPGQCFCKVIIEVIFDGQDTFKFKPSSSNCYLLQETENTIMGSLKPEETLDFMCKFKPVVAATNFVVVKIHIVNNPYEMLELKLTGKGFLDDITIEDLVWLPEVPVTLSSGSIYFGSRQGSRTTTLRPPSSHRVPSSSQHYSYALTFGKVCVGTKVLEKFTMKNNSSETVRYFWNSTLETIQLFPKLGHLQPKATQKIYAIFTPQTTVTLSKVPLMCSLMKISIENLSGVDWNSHKDCIGWIKHEDRVLRLYDIYIKCCIEDKEPPYTVLSTLNDLTLSISAEADYPRIICDKSSIEFPSTLLCQCVFNEVTLTNKSKVEAQFKWICLVTGTMNTEQGYQPVCSVGKLPVACLYPSRMIHNPSQTAPTPIHSPFNLLSARPYSSTTIVESLSSTFRCRKESNEFFQVEECYKDRLTNGQPFRVEPEKGSLTPGESLNIKIVFCPLQMFIYCAQLHCVVESSDPSESSFLINVKGAGLMSFCHLEVEESNYLASQTNRRNKLSLPPDVKVIQLNTLGTGIPFNKKFNIVNPTDTDYHFEWTLISPKAVENVSQFVCVVPLGLIQARKGVEMTFTFYPTEEGIHESLWLLTIPEVGLDQHVLFVGVAREPSVTFANPSLHLKHTIVGIEVFSYAVLTSKENINLEFSLIKDSLYSEGRYHNINIEPQTGIINAKSQVSFKVSYKPTQAGEFDFNVKFQITKKKEPLVLRVITYCYSVQALVTFSHEGNPKSDLSSSAPTLIDVGHMELRIPKVVSFNITNIGKSSFYFNWVYDKVYWKNHKMELNVLERQTLLTSQSRSVVSLSLTATKKSSFSELPCTLKILKGPTYDILFSGNAAEPEYIFSFSQYDFGPRFIQINDVCYNCVVLVFKNEGEVTLTVDKVSKDSKHLVIEMDTSSVPPRCELPIRIKFFPWEKKSYSDVIEFLVNGLYSNSVTIMGEAVGMKLQLMNAKHKQIDFGSVLLANTVTKTIDIVNKSRANARGVIFTYVENIPSIHIISLHPSEPVNIEADGTISLSITYMPLKRGVPLNEKVMLSCNGYTEPLCLLKGCGAGPEFSLCKDIICFGMVVANCSSTCKVTLSNSGEIGAKFMWNTIKASETFQIKPMEGYSSPGSVLPFDITFTPTSLTKSLRNEVTCQLENYCSLKLILTGSSMDIPPPKEYVDFVTPVRQKTSQEVFLKNPTMEKWVIHPTMSGEYYSGNDIVIIGPKSNASYEIVYAPLTMTPEKEKHVGSLFFPFPNGTCMMYGLNGVSSQPLPEGPFFWTIPCKNKEVNTIEITNWLESTSQRFTVEFHRLRGPLNENLCKIYGNSQIEVPPSCSREYQVHMFSYVECSVTFNVKFKNETTGEFALYSVVLDITECGILDTLRIETCVRTPSVIEIPFSNPLDSKVFLTCLPPRFELCATNSPLIIYPNSSGNLQLAYLPVREITNDEVTLMVDSSSLGTYCYKLLLKATPAPNEDPVLVNTSLGMNQSIGLPITNHTPSDVTFIATVKDSNLLLPSKEITVHSFQRANLTVIYEPIAVGEYSAMVTVHSNLAGTYVFPVMMTCTPSIPQGPYEIQPGWSITITFKNIFPESHVFNLSCDSNAFIIEEPKRSIQPKQVAKFIVKMLPQEQLTFIKWQSFPVTTKLLLTSGDASIKKYSWVYYIKGVLKEKPEVSKKK